MEIQWYGHTAFHLKKGGIKVVIDPFGKEVGLGEVKWKGDIITLCNKSYKDSIIPYLEGNPKVIYQQGEYEMSDIFIYGIQTITKGTEEKEGKENIIYKFEYENHNILHLSHLGKELTDKELDYIGIVDVLLLSLGSEKTLDPKESKKLIEDIEPRVIIPVDITQKDENSTNSSIVQEFLKIMGKTATESIESFDSSKYHYNPEGTDVVLLKRIAA